MTKECSKCKKTKLIGEFTKNKTRHDGLNSACRECHKKYTKEHYQKNKNYYIKKANKYIKKLADIIRKAKSIPCLDCKKEYPYYVMDFDHRDPKEKIINLSAASHSGLEIVKKEIAKCDVVCSNCHRERTQQRNSLIAQLD